MTHERRGKRFLLLGATGRLAQLIVETLRKNHDISTVSRGPTTDISWTPDSPLGLLPRCDAVIAAWGVTQGDDKAVSANVWLAELAREIAVECGADRVIHFSSAAVYGPGEDLTEEGPAHPANPYGKAKLAMEEMVLSHAAEPVRQTCLRLANVVGADSLAPALSGKDPVTLDRFEDGFGPMRSYISPLDLSDVLSRLACLPVATLPEVVNVAAPHPVRMEDLLRVGGKQIVWRRAPEQAVQTVTLSTQKLESLLPDKDWSLTARDMIADLEKARATT